MNIAEFLIDHQVSFQRVSHPRTYDSQRLAEAVDVPGDQVAKTVLVKTDADYVLAVLPATHRIDLGRIRQILQAEAAELASEEEVAERFNDCEVGAVPPFGSCYGMTTLVDDSLREAGEIVFEGSSHSEAIRMDFDDYVALESPVVTSLSYRE